MRVISSVLALAVCIVPNLSLANIPQTFESLLKPLDTKADVRGQCKKSEWKDVWNVNAKVVRAVDGDTIIAKIKDKEYNIRFLTIDTPETHFQGKSQGVWGEKAAAKLAQLLPVGNQVEIELEVEKCDRFGRVLAHVWKNGIDINSEMVRLGYAVNYCIWPNDKYCVTYGEYAQKNENAGKGIFSDPNLDLPYEYRRKLRGDDYSKYVGDVYTYDVYKPNHMNKVTTGSRIFFQSASEVHDPYELIEE